MKLINRLLFAILVVSFSGCSRTPTTSFTVATYNLRNDNSSDSIQGNGWIQRCPHIVELVQFHSFDLFGTQECFLNQLQDLQQGLPSYSYIGVGRDDGIDNGEHSAIFYRTDKFELMDKGDFWLSETPENPSIGWDAVLPRICSWGHFKYKKTGFEFLFFNLHMDHIGKQARINSAFLVLDKMNALAKGLPAILTGDFNVDQSNQAYQVFTDKGLLCDSYVTSDIKYASNGTFNGFKVDSFTESRIDHIFVTSAFHVRKYGILTDTYRSEKKRTSHISGLDCPEDLEIEAYQARVPSDHFPVVVELVY